MKTGIDALDKLLGPCEQKIDNQTIALIRGAPGSGKTTLSLQILAEHLYRLNTAGAFISLEVPPACAIQGVKNKFSNRLNEILETSRSGTEKRLVEIGREDFESHFSSGDWEIVKDGLTRFLIDKFKLLKEGRELLVILDSMNLLTSMAQYHMTPRGQTIDLRMIVHSIWNLLEDLFDHKSGEKYFAKTTLIIIGEHHPSGINVEESLVSESFTCDVEILLAPEPISGHSTIQPSMISPLGYTIERCLSDEPFSQKPQSVEIRSFCRVLKSRYTPNQSRRCAYDIIEGKGVVFAETLAGDGSILLFQENEKQKMNWEEFITRDIPLQFPALRYTLFDRKGLQRTFATQRHYKHSSRKIDAYIACFDTYWINWFWQLCQRSAIREAMLTAFAEGTEKELERKLEQNEPLRKQWAFWISELDEKFTEFLNKNQCDEDAYVSLFIEFRQLADRMSSELPQGNANEILIALWKIWQRIEEGKIGFLQILPQKKLRLFGECRSPIIEELNKPRGREDEDKERTVGVARSPGPGASHRPRNWRHEEDFLSVPYNANVSFLVFQKKLLKDTLQKISKQDFVVKLKALCQQQNSALGGFRSDNGQAEPAICLSRDGQIGPMTFEQGFDNWIRQAYGQNLNGHFPDEWIPTTWEEIIVLCEMKPKHHFLLETQTIDTFLCTFLEVFWGCGGDLEITPAYKFINENKVKEDLFQVFRLLCLLFESGTIERNSTLNVEEFVSRFNPIEDKKSKRRGGYDNWLFARHWYSTLVDTLTARDKEKKNYLWHPPEDMELGIMPLPYHLCSAIEQNKDKLKPVACWGEWHLAVLAGSENEALAVELINNLMSSQKICERAASCAALPTVQDFYDRYDEDPCLNLPERPEINPIEMTYRKLRTEVFEYAKARSSIFDYRHCMRELHATLSNIQKNPSEAKMKLNGLVTDVIKRISEYKTRDVMIH